ncbi:MAG: glycosyltransferase [bacterium]|nr:glycosyltransferase [bacterium]
MGKISIANLKKTIYYLRRNGLTKTVCAAGERLRGTGEKDYRWEPVPKEILESQREQAAELSRVRFSIVVPAYRTPPEYLAKMLESVLSQTYPNWELLLTDATEDDSVKTVVDSFGDCRVRYCRLPKNNGIAENTNAGIELAEGDYIALLDHDDMLTENALFEMASAVEKARGQGTELQLMYSDEDKCDGGGKNYYDPHRKEKFNLDLLLSNNYICHFMAMKRELMQELRLRQEYDGAQDYDLALRAAGRLMEREEEIAHIPLVLYHWRSHSLSTAENPQSKRYAYDAGRRAVQAFADARGWKAKVTDTEHLGFYRLEYAENPLKMRADLGAAGGRLVAGGRITGGRMTKDGQAPDKGLPVSFSGYMHRAVLQQDAEALDIRNMEVREELYGLFEETLGAPYVTVPGTGVFDASSLPEGTDYIEESRKISSALRQKGYRLLFIPELTRNTATGK